MWRNANLQMCGIYSYRVFRVRCDDPNRLPQLRFADIFSLQVASVNGGYSEVLETTCGSLIIAVGETLYELSGVEFIDRETDLVDMSSAECSGVDTAQPADCYRCVVCCICLRRQIYA